MKTPPSTLLAISSGTASGSRAGKSGPTTQTCDCVAEGFSTREMKRFPAGRGGGSSSSGIGRGRQLANARSSNFIASSGSTSPATAMTESFGTHHALCCAAISLRWIFWTIAGVPESG